MSWFDSHIHSIGRSIEDLERMRELGVKYAMNCAFYPVVPEHPETLIDLFRRMVEFERERGREAGIELYPALGIHPRCIPPKYEVVVDEISEGVAIGEIGLERGDEREREVFESQLKVAMREDLPCIIHTPKEGKEIITKKTLEILERLSFPETLAVIDHVTSSTIEEVLKRGYFCGLSVQSGKLTPEEVVKLVEEYGAERIMLNSDVGFVRAQLDAVPRTARMISERFGEDVAKKVALENARKFFRV